MSQPITFAEDSEVELSSSLAGEDLESSHEPGSGSLAAVALLATRRHEASRLVQAVAIASQQLAQFGHVLVADRGSVAAKRLDEIRDELERAWRLAVAVEASVKGD